jgi:hypothetical protein
MKKLAVFLVSLLLMSGLAFGKDRKKQSDNSSVDFFNDRAALPSVALVCETEQCKKIQQQVNDLVEKMNRSAVEYRERKARKAIRSRRDSVYVPYRPVVPVYPSPVFIPGFEFRSSLDATKHLGQWSANPYAPNSTSNMFGTYGNPYSQKSINNEYGTFGSAFSLRNTKNPYATNPPRLFDSQGNYRGQLSTNPYLPDSVSNPFGRYGSQFSPDSINNPFGAGSQFNPDSPTNPFGKGLTIIEPEK